MDKTLPPSSNAIDKLEQQADKLLALCYRLMRENKSLQNEVEQLSKERAELLKQKEHARSHVETMISRLKSMGEAP